MLALISVSQAQHQMAEYVQKRRLALELTQAALAKRSGVSLATLRKFEQTGIISLESLLKLLLIIGGLDKLVESLKPDTPKFNSIDEVIKSNQVTERKRGKRQ